MLGVFGIQRTRLSSVRNPIKSMHGSTCTFAYTPKLRERLSASLLSIIATRLTHLSPETKPAKEEYHQLPLISPIPQYERASKAEISMWIRFSIMAWRLGILAVVQRTHCRRYSCEIRTESWGTYTCTLTKRHCKVHIKRVWMISRGSKDKTVVDGYKNVKALSPSNIAAAKSI